MNDYIELHRIISVILRRWWLILLVAVVTAAVGYTVSRRQTPVYKATTTVLVGQFMQSTNLSKTDIQTSEGFAQTYADLALRQPVLQGVVNQLSLNKTWQDLKKQVKVTPVTGTQLIEIDVEASSVEMASKMADAVASQLIDISPTTSSKESQTSFAFTRDQLDILQQKIIVGQAELDKLEATIQATTSVIELEKLQAQKLTLEDLVANWERNYIEITTLVRQQSTPNNFLTVIEPAEADAVPVRPKIWLNTLLSAVVGMVLGLGLVFLLETLTDTYQSLDDLYQFQDLNVLGVIEPIRGRKYSDKVITHYDPSSSLVESYRMTRNKIQFVAGSPPAKSLMVTSALPGEGKTITASNLALVFAQGGMRTILVDADLRNPTLHHLFSLDNEEGLADLLNDQGDVDKVIGQYLKKTTSRNLQVITGGKPTSDYSELMGLERMEEILTTLQGMADLVIFDSQPALLVADTTILSKKVDGVVLVIRARKSRRSETRHVLDDLHKAGASLYGCVYNHAKGNKTYAVYKSKKDRPTLLDRIKRIGRVKSSRMYRR